MKKNLILSLCVLVGLAACQKENKGVTSNTSKAKFNLTSNHDVSLPPAYTDLTLMPDGSYEGYWNSCGIKITGNPAWDELKYPSLVNGVPVTAVNFSTYDGSSSIDYVNSGADGNVFQVSQIQVSLSEFNASGFNSDLGTYWGALDTWVSGGQVGTAPAIGTYVKDTYTTTVGGNQVKTYTGKLIRVTTGSHLAIATQSYPLPTATVVPGNPINYSIHDTAYNQNYTVSGSYNELTSAKINSTSYAVSGTYKTTVGVGSTLVGTIIRADGTQWNFNIFIEF